MELVIEDGGESSFLKAVCGMSGLSSNFADPDGGQRPYPNASICLAGVYKNYATSMQCYSDCMRDVAHRTARTYIDPFVFCKYVSE